MLDRQVHPGAVEGDADDVEPDLRVGRRIVTGRDPGGRDAADPQSLMGADCEDRPLGAEVGALTSGLDLDEDEGAAVDRDDVDLAEPGAGIALDETPAGSGQPGRDQVLGPPSDPLPRECHRARR